MNTTVTTRVTPFTDSLLNQSIWFSNAYGPGYRTDQGLVAVLSNRVQGVVGRAQIENLPLNGRSFMNLAQLQPGLR